MYIALTKAEAVHTSELDGQTYKAIASEKLLWSEFFSLYLSVCLGGFLICFDFPKDV